MMLWLDGLTLGNWMFQSHTFSLYQVLLIYLNHSENKTAKMPLWTKPEIINASNRTCGRMLCIDTHIHPGYTPGDIHRQIETWDPLKCLLSPSRWMDPLLSGVLKQEKPVELRKGCEWGRCHFPTLPTGLSRRWYTSLFANVTQESECDRVWPHPIFHGRRRKMRQLRIHASIHMEKKSRAEQDPNFTSFQIFFSSTDCDNPDFRLSLSWV